MGEELDRAVPVNQTARREADIEEIVRLCQNSAVGKLLPTALYVHISALQDLDPLLQSYEQHARSAEIDLEEANIVKFSTDKPKISYLFYPDFDRNPHPALKCSIVVNAQTLEFSYRKYDRVDNPPILHRKETFVTPNYPLYEQFAQLTLFEVALGLLDKSSFIGTRQEWEYRLLQKRIGFVGHRLICPIDPTSNNKNKIAVRIDRHKAAIVRKELSRPVRLALEAGLFSIETTFFDYGCGYGGDIERLGKRGYQCSGWDPYYRPDTPRTSADIVNLGYVINVIEDIEERREVLVKAWELTGKILIVAAQVLIDDRLRGLVAYGDGIITSRNTFQKYYQQEELKTYIDSILDVDAIPAGLGIYFVFKEETKAQAFRASRFHSRATTPRIKTQVKNFEDYRKMLTPLMNFITERGRLPVKQELPEEVELKAEFGSMRRAFKLILQVTEEKEWEAIAQKRRQELILYLALSNFSRPLAPRQLPRQVREDIKALFGNYKQASLLAEMMLFSLRDLDKIASVCDESSIGKKLRNSLLVHLSALESLAPLLRLYEGCASRAVGRLEDANVIKFYFDRPKISYLLYPNFDTDPHPILHTSMEINLKDLRVSYRDYYLENNPPVLHQKEMLVTPDYPLYDKFARLSSQEQDWGLLDDISAISHLQGWLQRLDDRCATVKGHRLQWRKDADPYKLKLLRSQIYARKKNAD
ncbi:MAG: DNA phosphorothioation-associated putative methyltransferase [Prochloraceae cyanobacterium]|nr:DNA phosphorothioation-associated putative methyltransferase [Prochloraceae cyanobacterium]